MSVTDKNSIIIVSGLPRSGTSLMMQVLGAGGATLLFDDQRRPDEDNPKGYFEYTPVKTLIDAEADRSWLQLAIGKVVKIVSPLLIHLPKNVYKYRIVFMQRDLAEVLASQRTMISRHHLPAQDVNDREMTLYLAREIKVAETLLKKHPCFSTLFVDFSQLVESPRAQLMRLVKFTEIDLDLPKMQRVIDGSLYRNRLETA